MRYLCLFLYLVLSLSCDDATKSNGQTGDHLGGHQQNQGGAFSETDFSDDATASQTQTDGGPHVDQHTDNPHGDGAISDASQSDGSTADGSITNDMQVPEEPICTVFADGLSRSFQLGNWRLEAFEGSGKWILKQRDELKLQAPGFCVDQGDGSAIPDALIKGTMDVPRVRSLFGAFQFNQSQTQWFGSRTPVTIVEEQMGQVISLRSQDENQRNFTLRFELLGDQTMRIRLFSSFAQSAFAWSCQPDEAFFGLGAQSTGDQLQGRTYPLWTMEQGIGKNDDGSGWPLKNTREASYAPMGILHSSANYSLLLTQDDYQSIALCDQAPYVELAHFTTEIEDNQVQGEVHVRSEHAFGFDLLSAEEPKGRISQIKQRLGRFEMPAPWILGVWQDAVHGEARIRSVVDRIKTYGIPTSAIWTEDWIGGENVGAGLRLSYAWEWDQNKYPNLPQLIRDLHQDHLAFLGYFNTFVPTTTRMYEEGENGDHLVKKADGTVYLTPDPAGRQTALVDLTSPNANLWFDGYLQRALTLGLDGWMADFTEWMPVEAKLSNGLDGWHYHNRYPIDYQKLNQSAFERFAQSQSNLYPHVDFSSRLPTNNQVFFPRSGWASINGGTAGISPMMWGGDQNTDWSEEDGIGSVIPLAVHLGLSGVAIFASDIAGYTTILDMPNVSKELFFRWTALGAFHPLMRTHHGSDECENWAFDSDEESTLHFKRYATLHQMLYPYLFSALKSYQQDGISLTRHPWLMYPNHRDFWQHAQQSFFLGDLIYVSPVVTQGAVVKRVVLPNDEYVGLLDGKRYLKGNDAVPSMIAPQSEAFMTDVMVGVADVPVWIKSGTALILQAPDLMSLFTHASLVEQASGGLGGQLGGRLGLWDGHHRLRVGLYGDALGEVNGEYSGYLTVAGHLIREDMPMGILVDSGSGNVRQVEACVVGGEKPCLMEDGGVDMGIWQAGDRVKLYWGDGGNLGEVVIWFDQEVEVGVYWGERVWPAFVRAGGSVNLGSVGRGWCGE